MVEILIPIALVSFLYALRKQKQINKKHVVYHTRSKLLGRYCGLSFSKKLGKEKDVPFRREN